MSSISRINQELAESHKLHFGSQGLGFGIHVGERFGPPNLANAPYQKMGPGAQH